MIVVVGNEGFIGKSFISYLKKNHPKENFIGINRNNYELLSRTDFSKDELVSVFFCISNELQYNKNKPIQNYLDSEQKTIQQIVSLIDSNKLRIIYLSSAGTLYKANGIEPATEATDLTPKNNYGIFKLQMENFMINRFSGKGKSLFILRASNIYGELQKPNVGQGIISTFVNNVLNNRETYVFFDGNDTRDYLYIDDFCAALFLIASHKDFDGVKVYNVSYGRSFSTSSVIDIITACLAEGSLQSYLDLTKYPKSSIGFGPTFSVVESSKFREDFGWSPIVNLHEGIKKVIDHAKRI